MILRISLGFKMEFFYCAFRFNWYLGSISIDLGSIGIWVQLHIHQIGLISLIFIFLYGQNGIFLLCI